MENSASEHVLELRDVSVAFGRVEITDGVSLGIRAGEVFGLVGESGCGKSVTAMSILNLLPKPSGRLAQGKIFFEGREISNLSLKEMRRVRGQGIAMIFQDPGSALNPVVRLGIQLREALMLHGMLDEAGEKRLQELLVRVGFSDPQRILDAYPHELSGGMLQRVMIAMALLPSPKVLLADEPTTALDVTVQAQVMELLQELAREEQAAVLLITHNLNLVAQYAHNMAVMYAGRIAELGPVEDIISNPLHPYTRALLNAIPHMDSGMQSLVPIPGQVPQPQDFPEGCRFQARCEKAQKNCEAKPELLTNGNRKIACFYC
jgi:oligopeptide/dipeptide ABC transporter ATP-binding protein